MGTSLCRRWYEPSSCMASCSTTPITCTTNSSLQFFPQPIVARRARATHQKPRRAQKRGHMLPNMTPIAAGCRASSHTKPTPRGGHRRRTSRGGPSWDARRCPARPLGASPPAGAVAKASAPDTDRPRAAASCHAGGLPYTQPAPRRRPDPPGRPPYPTAVRKVRP